MKAIVITDALNGFGLDLASDLARLGYFIIGIGKDFEESEHIKTSVIRRYANSKIDTFVGTFDNIKNVRQVILNIKVTMTNYNIESIYAYIGNHQIFETELIKNENDIENVFFQNYLSNFIIVHALLPYLQNEPYSKIILPTVPSLDSGLIDFKDIYHEKSYNGAVAYKTAKVCNAVIAGELNRRFNVGDTPVATLLYEDKVVTKPDELNKEEVVKGLKKIFGGGDTLFKTYSGIEAMLTISDHRNQLYFKYSKSHPMPSICKNEELGNKLYDFSLRKGRLIYE